LKRKRYFVGLGSNLGDRLASLRGAVEELAQIEGVELRACSGVWETRPVGPGTGAFLNAAVELRANVEAEALLEQMLEIEARHGRVRVQRWGDRTLDLDLLCGFEADGHELVIDSDTLTLPHPEMFGRDFVLQPLVELDEGLRVGGQSCALELERLKDEERTLLRRLDAPLCPG
jgi:2-amino-4-hydroxy-6-hydroxymethyldihydropteridine diphosphokinase